MPTFDCGTMGPLCDLRTHVASFARIQPCDAIALRRSAAQPAESSLDRSFCGTSCARELTLRQSSAREMSTQLCRAVQADVLAGRALCFPYRKNAARLTGLAAFVSHAVGAPRVLSPRRVFIFALWREALSCALRK